MYNKTLLIQRKYTRENTITREDQFFSAFKDWTDKTYSQNGTPTEAEWDTLCQADSQYQYNPDASAVQPTYEEEGDEELLQHIMGNEAR